MTLLAERQSAFAAALLDPAMPQPGGLAAPLGAVTEQRFGIYRNNVAVGLIEALRSAYPVVNRLVGDAFFSVAALAHARETPPSSPVLLSYGAEFAHFIAGFEPAQSLPYLADVARLEWMWLESYHSGEAEPLSIQDLQVISVGQWPELALALHPAVRTLCLDHSVLSIWINHQHDDEPATIEMDDQPEFLLMTRPQETVFVRAVSPGVIAFVTAIGAGATLAEAMVAAMAQDCDFVIGDAIALLFEAGAFAGMPRTDKPETGANDGR